MLPDGFSEPNSELQVDDVAGGAVRVQDVVGLRSIVGTPYLSA